MTSKTIPNASELRERPEGQTLAQWHAAVVEARAEHVAAEGELLNQAEEQGRDLLASERRQLDRHNSQLSILDAIQKRIEASPEGQFVDRTGVVAAPFGGRPGDYREGMPLASGQTVEGYARARALAGDDEENLDFGKCLKGVASGDWHGAAREFKAMTEGAGSAGGFLVPTVLSGQIIDMARNVSRVLQAGAMVVPMENRTLDVPKWVGDPTAAWHTESAAIAPSDATLGKLTLTAQALASNVEVSWELLEDAPGVGDKLKLAFAAVFALKLDLAALYGSGTAPEPRGVKNTSGISTASAGANGAALTSWDAIVDAVGRLQDQNETPNGIIYATRTERALSKLKDTTNQPLQPPEILADLKRFSTNQVPVNLTQGTSSLASDIFTADWTQLLVGIRTRLQIKVLDQRYADTGQTGFVAWFRGDTAVARPKAFDVLTGVL